MFHQFVQVVGVDNHCALLGTIAHRLGFDGGIGGDDAPADAVAIVIWSAPLQGVGRAVLLVIGGYKGHGVAVVTSQTYDNGLVGVVIDAVALGVPLAVVVNPQGINIGIVIAIHFLIDLFGVVDQVDTFAVDGELIHIKLTFLDSSFGVGIDVVHLLGFLVAEREGNGADDIVESLFQPVFIHVGAGRE